MDNASCRFERTLTATVPALRALLVEIDHWAKTVGLASRLRKSILIFTEETFLNAVKHGTRGRRVCCTLSVLFEVIDAHHIHFTLKDTTPPFNPLNHTVDWAQISNLAPKPIGGIGIALMRKIANLIHYKWDNGANVLSGEICVDSDPES